MTRRRLVPAVLLLTSCCLLPVSLQAAHMEPHDGLPVVYLEGSPYEIGHQHGELLRDQVRQSVRRLLGYFRRYPHIPFFGPRAVNWWLGSAWRQAEPFIPSAYLEELRGLSDASGGGLKDLRRLHAIPDRTYACSGLAVWGHATRDGRLIHTRNLDWNIRAEIQRGAAVFVVRPEGRHAYVSVGWAGFIGVMTGINDQQVSIGQVGAETDDVSYRGLPMPFVMRRVMEEAGDVDQAARLIADAPRTVGVNYLVADAKARRAVAVETTRRHAAVFEANDPKEAAVPYARPIPDAVFRADTAVDPVIRGRQIASGGNPRIPGLEPPTGSAYERRYLGQGAGILSHYGAIDAQVAIEIAKSVAPPSNVQSVIFAWPELWVANADGETRAAETTYHRLDLDALLSRREAGE